MILKNLAHHAVVRGHTVRFSTASDMLADLAAQDSSAALARRLRRYIQPHPPLHRRGRLPLLQQPLRRPALRGRHPSLRRQQADPAQHQQGLHRLGPGLPARRLRRHPRRPARPPRRDHRDRRRQLPPQGSQGAERLPHQAAPRQEALSRLFTGELHRRRMRVSPAPGADFTGELHRIPADCRDHQHLLRLQGEHGARLHIPERLQRHRACRVPLAEEGRRAVDAGGSRRGHAGVGAGWVRDLSGGMRRLRQPDGHLEPGGPRRAQLRHAELSADGRAGQRRAVGASLQPRRAVREDTVAAALSRRSRTPSRRPVRIAAAAPVRTAVRRVASITARGTAVAGSLRM